VSYGRPTQPWLDCRDPSVACQKQLHASCHGDLVDCCLATTSFHLGSRRETALSERQHRLSQLLWHPTRTRSQVSEWVSSFLTAHQKKPKAFGKCCTEWPRTHSTQCTLHAPLPIYTVWQTDTANISNKSLHLMHSMQIKNVERRTPILTTHETGACFMEFKLIIRISIIILQRIYRWSLQETNLKALRHFINHGWSMGRVGSGPGSRRY